MSPGPQAPKPPGASGPFAQVALPVPARQTFVYRVPEPLDAAAVPGAPVEVPFRGRALRGVVLARAARTDVAKVAELAQVLGPPLLTPHLLELAEWVADYYLAPIGEVVSSLLPGGHGPL